jgi:hypothetical protein
MQKSGGSSAFAYIIGAFRSERGWRDKYFQRIWAADFVPNHANAIKRGDIRFLYGHFDPSPVFETFPGKFFTIVRDPVERVISLYNFCATMDNETLGGITGVRDHAFPEVTRSTWSLSTDMISMIDTVRAGLSFADFIRLPPQLFLGLESWPDYLAYLPKAGDPADYAGRFDVLGLADDMDWTLKELAALMGWHPPTSVPYVNRTPRYVVTRDTLTAQDIAVIECRTVFETALYRIAKGRAALKSAPPRRPSAPRSR